MLQKTGEKMKDLRFVRMVALSIPYSGLYAIPKAEYMIAHKEKYSREQRFLHACRIMEFMRKTSRTTTEVYGLENLPKEGNYIMYPNHQGKYDALSIMPQLPAPCGVLWEEKKAGMIMASQVSRLVDAVPIDLTDMKAKALAISEVINQVKSGRNFLIFPEGGYADNKNTLQEFNAGCFSCSLRTKTAIVPVVLYDSYKAMNGNNLKPVTTQLHFLPAIYYEEYQGMNKKEIAQMVKQRIQAKLDEIEGKR